MRDFIAASGLFLASAAVVLWQNAHLAVLWDASYILDTSYRIALGQTPYRDFPLAHAPLTFLIQALLVRLGGRVFFHHVLYAALAGGLGSVLSWRVVLHTLRDRMQAAWLGALLLAAPLIALGIYSILPLPFYDCDCVLSILVVILLLQRLPVEPSTSHAGPAGALLRPFIAGAAIPLPLFFKQNIGLPLVAVTLTFLTLLLIATRMRRTPASRIEPRARTLAAVLAGAVSALVAAALLLQFTVGLDNYLHWTIKFASERRLPGFADMLGIYADSSLLWWLPAVAAALLLLRCSLGKALWARLLALAVLAAPFLWTLASLFLADDAEDRATDLLVLWPLLLILSAALTIWNLCRRPSLRTALPAIVLVTINGTLMSQQLWGSTYAIWPLLLLLVAEMIAFLASVRPAGVPAEFAHRLFPLAPPMAAVISATLLICGGFYTASEERLSYAQLPEGPASHSAVPALKGMAVSGSYLPAFDELLHFAADEIPADDGLILIPGEDPFYFATGRVPQFPVLLFDNATDPYSPMQLAEQARKHNIRWLVVKRALQLKEDPTPQRDAALRALLQDFAPYRKLAGYDVYRRP